MKNIRNFTIIAHVDHGKSTLADQLLIKCNAVNKREIHGQMLDTMELEKERGITIKAQCVRLEYTHENQNYILNLIDTPGHADFSYEVSRSLAACEVSILLIDATKGVQAQTISTLNKAKEQKHIIIPVLNKIDLPSADLTSCYDQIFDLGLDIELIHEISAKTGDGIDALIETIIKKTPCPESNSDDLQCLVFDSWYNKYLGVVTLVKVVNGEIKINQNVKACSNNKIFNVLKLGFFTPEKQEVKSIKTGEIGFIVTQIKSCSEMKIGDTLICSQKQTPPLPGFKKNDPKVFCTFFPETADKALHVKESLEKYQLNDSGFSFTAENSDLYGMSFLCGFLGLLHLEIVKSRLETEFDAQVVITIPTVIYKLEMKNGDVLFLNNPSLWPSLDQIQEMYEPEVECTIFSSTEHVGPIINLCINARGVDMNIEQDSKSDNKSIITTKIPLSEIILNFDDELKSKSSGYASFQYKSSGYRKSKLEKLIILINGEVINEFGLIVCQSNATTMAKNFAENLKNLLPRLQVAIKIQVAANTPANVIARADISAYRKDVVAKCYGGDISRKAKLLDKQKKGKKNMTNKSKHWILSKIPNNAIRSLFKIQNLK